MTPYQACEICLKENKRKPEYEPITLTDPWACYFYARHIIKGRWTEAEPVVLKNSFYSYWYAVDIIKDRWPEAEPRIKQDEGLWHNYCQHFHIKKNKINWKIGL